VLERTDVDKFRPIHQLDFATSGVLLLGTDKQSAAHARKMFDSGRVRKCYLAILEGRMETREAWVDAPIAMYEGPATLPPRGEPGTHGGAGDFRMMIGNGRTGNSAKPAQTRIVRLGHGVLRGQECTKVAMYPVTGRRHQLRLHAAHLRHAILGDWTYGNRQLAESLPRMYLHAWKLQMEHTDGRPTDCWTTPDPFHGIFDDFVTLVGYTPA
jgi:23S rRNA-/tRNA-specific pseudouridylate synthase